MVSMRGALPRKVPCCSATTARSVRLAPPPPSASGTPMVGRPIWVSASHRAGSKPLPSALRTRSGCDSLA
jgi:hypothetical protein